MKHWDDQSRAEYEAASSEAWLAGKNTTERIDAFVKIVLDAQQAHRAWATDVLTAATRDGMGKRLTAERKAKRKLVVAFAGGKHEVSSIGGVSRKTEHGVVFEQLSFVDMTRDELVARQRSYDAMNFSLRRNKAMAKRLIDLIDATGAKTARAAAEAAEIDIDEYLAESA